MKTIKLYIETGEPITINDEDNKNIEEYTSELSSILQEGNIVVLNTSSSSIILRPSRITGIEVKETNVKKFVQPIKNIVKKPAKAKKGVIKKLDTKKVVETQEKDKNEDVILDE